MEQYLYDPPVGSPPLEWIANGEAKVVQPTDQFWKRETKDVRIAEQFDRNGTKKKDVFRPVTSWVPDDTRNIAAKKTGNQPDNTIWLTAAEARTVAQSKYAPLNRYLIPMRKVAEQRQKSRALLDAEHTAQLEQLRRMYEEEQRVAKDSMMNEVKEMRLEMKKMLQATAKDIGVDVKILENALQKHRKDVEVEKKAGGAPA